MITPSGPEPVNHKGLTAFPVKPNRRLQGADNVHISGETNVISSPKKFSWVAEILYIIVYYNYLYISMRDCGGAAK
jgi:hypothetical protein